MLQNDVGVFKIYNTLRMSGVMGLGPLEENDATLGAMISFQVSPARIVAIGFLKKVTLLESLRK